VFAAVAGLLAAMSAPDWAAVAVPAPPLMLAVVAVCGVAWLLAPPGWPARSLGAVAMLPLFVWPSERPPPGALWVTALDIGQGSAVVLETRDQAWLYDAGPRHSQDSDAGERVVLPYLRSRGIEALDGLVVSHLDQDHSGSACPRGIMSAVLTSIPAGTLLGAQKPSAASPASRWSRGICGCACCTRPPATMRGACRLTR
jgi:competence protein ComEC